MNSRTGGLIATDPQGRAILAPPPPQDNERQLLEQDRTRECMRGKGYDLARVRE
jgi:hypothetical protein